MPELPEVETVRRGIAPAVRGRCITDVIVRERRFRHPLAADFAERLRGRTIAAVRRRGKYLVLELGDEALIIHLGMSGILSLSPQPPLAKHAHVGLLLDDSRYLIYTDPRRFGCLLLTASPAVNHPRLRSLGPEPLLAAFTAKRLQQSLAAKSVPIKTALMDGRVVAGIGNIYASEALFAAGIHPQTAAGRLSGKRLARLVTAIKTVLRRAIRAGGSSMRDFVDGDGKPGYFQTQWTVYGRNELPCVCCTAFIRRCRQSGRATYYCPKCQT